MTFAINADGKWYTHRSEAPSEEREPMTVKVKVTTEDQVREVGTASEVAVHRNTVNDPFASPFSITPPVEEVVVELKDFSGTPDPSLYGGIYRELRSENKDLRRGNEALQASNVRLERKLRRQQEGFEEYTAGQAKARDIRKKGEEALKANATLAKDNAYLHDLAKANQKTIAHLEAELEREREAALMRSAPVDSSVIQEYVEQNERLGSKVERLQKTLSAAEAETYKQVDRKMHAWGEQVRVEQELKELQKKSNAFVEAHVRAAHIINDSVVEWEDEA